MRNVLNNRSYPFFLGPQEHGLAAYYRLLNRLGLILILLVFVLNEFLIRPNLATYKKTPEALWSLIGLTLNADVPMSHALTVIAAITFFGLCTWFNFYLLPKWGPRATKVGMKSGLPKNEEYAIAYFGISNRIEKWAFSCWHSIVVPIIFFYSSLLTCMFISLLRGLS
jgi:hypothetical protein